MRQPKMLKTLLLLRWLKLFHLKYCFLCRADVWPLGRLKRLIIDKNQNNLAAVKPAMLRPAMFRNPPPFTYSPSSAGDVVVYVAVVDDVVLSFSDVVSVDVKVGRVVSVVKDVASVSDVLSVDVDVEVGVGRVASAVVDVEGDSDIVVKVDVDSEMVVEVDVDGEFEVGEVGLVVDVGVVVGVCVVAVIEVDVDVVIIVVVSVGIVIVFVDVDVSVEFVD